MHPASTNGVQHQHEPEQNTIRWDQDADGIVTLTLDDPNQRANTMNDAFRPRSPTTVDRLAGREGLDHRRHRHLGEGHLLRRRRPASCSSRSPTTTWPSSPPTSSRIKADLRAAGDARQAGRRRAQRRRARRRPGDRAGLPPPHRARQPQGAVRLARGHPRPAARRRRRHAHRPDARHRRRPDEGAAAGQPATSRPRRSRSASSTNSPRRRRRCSPRRAPGSRRTPRPRSPGTSRATGCPAARRPTRRSPAMLPAFPANLRKQLKGAPMPAPHHIMCAAVEGARSTSTPRCASRAATSSTSPRARSRRT